MTLKKTLCRTVRPHIGFSFADPRKAIYAILDQGATIAFAAICRVSKMDVSAWKVWEFFSPTFDINELMIHVLKNLGWTIVVDGF